MTTESEVTSEAGATKIGDHGLADSGRRETFSTGAQRERLPGKGRYDLVSPVALANLAKIMEAGARKYAPRNWEQGLPLSSFLDSALRHLMQLAEGDTTEDHAGQAQWNIHCLIHTKEMVRRGNLPAELDDLPDYREKPF